MASKAVFGICTPLQAETVLNELKGAGFSNNDISVLVPDTMGSHDLATDKATKAPEGTATGATTGGILGGALGWLAGIGALAIPGLGPFIAAGPIMGALSGAAAGATAGGLTGALVGLGIPEYEAKQYEAKVKGGNILISVHTDDGDERTHVKEVFTRYQADDIATAGEKRAS